MFFRVFAFLAVVAAVFASPKAEPQPQLLAYSAPGVVPAVGYTGYSPVAYSGVSPYAAAAYPYAYSGYYLR